MSLTKEQVIELNRLNELYHRFDAKVDELNQDAEVLVHKYMLNSFPMEDVNRAHLDALSERRKEILAGRQTPSVKQANRTGDTVQH